jgi:hypothetical protein
VTFPSLDRGCFGHLARLALHSINPPSSSLTVSASRVYEYPSNGLGLALLIERTPSGAGTRNGPRRIARSGGVTAQKSSFILLRWLRPQQSDHACSRRRKARHPQSDPRTNDLNRNFAPRLTPHPGKIMRIFVFKSEANPHLRAFAGDLAGNQLPKQLGPWSATGAIAPDGNPPHNLSRDVIEAAIEKQGFQLWRQGQAGPIEPDRVDLGELGALQRVV